MMTGRSVVVSDRKSTRLNSSHLVISYAVFCLKKKEVVRAMYVPPPATARACPTAQSLAGVGRDVLSVEAAREVVLKVCGVMCVVVFFFNNAGPTEIYPLSPHAPLPI